MSWDIYMQDFNGVDDFQNIPDDWNPKPLGYKDSIIEKITSVFPNADFTDLDWGVLETDEFSIEFNIGTSQYVEAIMFHVSGGESAVEAMNKLIIAIGHKAVDTSTGKFIDTCGHTKGMSKWREFKNEVIGFKKSS